MHDGTVADACEDAALLLKVSKWTIYRWIEEGRLRATKIGRGSLRVFQTSVDGLIGGLVSITERLRMVREAKCLPCRLRARKRKK